MDDSLLASSQDTGGSPYRPGARPRLVHLTGGTAGNVQWLYRDTPVGGCRFQPSEAGAWEIRKVTSEAFVAVGKRKVREEPRALSSGDLVSFWRQAGRSCQAFMFLTGDSDVPLWGAPHILEVEDQGARRCWPLLRDEAFTLGVEAARREPRVMDRNATICWDDGSHQLVAHTPGGVCVNGVAASPRDSVPLCKGDVINVLRAGPFRPLPAFIVIGSAPQQVIEVPQSLPIWVPSQTPATPLTQTVALTPALHWVTGSMPAGQSERGPFGSNGTAIDSLEPASPDPGRVPAATEPDGSGQAVGAAATQSAWHDAAPAEEAATPSAEHDAAPAQEAVTQSAEHDAAPAQEALSLNLDRPVELTADGAALLLSECIPGKACPLLQVKRVTGRHGDLVVQLQDDSGAFVLAVLAGASSGDVDVNCVLRVIDWEPPRRQGAGPTFIREFSVVARCESLLEVDPEALTQSEEAAASSLQPARAREDESSGSYDTPPGHHVTADAPAARTTAACGLATSLVRGKRSEQPEPANKAVPSSLRHGDSSSGSYDSAPGHSVAAEVPAARRTAACGSAASLPRGQRSVQPEPTSEGRSWEAGSEELACALAATQDALALPASTAPGQQALGGDDRSTIQYEPPVPGASGDVSRATRSEDAAALAPAGWEQQKRRRIAVVEGSGALERLRSIPDAD
eukprot:TRINITY_DN26014_c0_g2_i1.p1 TRINITY_DN26014_c0_g2~~TRINITY_DN26014_c0_g2_i1.p1  ORF type:complete len:685 (+),score=107.05 TRINITY_DN26014_c0_g2_i1:154-2208(+)